jgi:uncharacterized protein YbgA (DUF1722 family)/uncharacterized protein YbbK (DUF523 family)
MADFPKPRIVVSRCLGFDNCRFNGEIIQDNFVSRLREHVEFVPVCPEVEIGLGTPRPAVRLVSAAGGKFRMIQPTTGADLTGAMHQFSERFLDSLDDSSNGVDGFILTHRSPSCGVGDAKYYAGLERAAALGKTNGLFADSVLKRFPDLAVEDDGRLSNLRIREHFLTRIFAFARLRALRKSSTVGELVRFHAGHKFLLLSYNERKMRELGRIVAGAANQPLVEVVEAYCNNFYQALGSLPRITAQINVLMHALGHFSEKLSLREKRHFLDTLEAYRCGQVPLHSATSILWSWTLRFDSAYLQDQVFFAPFPDDLLAIHDSGKGREPKAVS